MCSVLRNPKKPSFSNRLCTCCGNGCASRATLWTEEIQHRLVTWRSSLQPQGRASAAVSGGRPSQTDFAAVVVSTASAAFSGSSSFTNMLCDCCSGSRGTVLCYITRPSITNIFCDCCSGGCGRAYRSGPRRSSFSFSTRLCDFDFCRGAVPCDLESFRNRLCDCRRFGPELRQVPDVLLAPPALVGIKNTQPGRQQLHPYGHDGTTHHVSLFTSCTGSPPTLTRRMGTETMHP